MQPKRQETETQYDLFKIALADLLDPRHELVLLAENIDWQALDTAFGEFSADDKGAPALPIRLVAGLHYLKHAFGHSADCIGPWVRPTTSQYFLWLALILSSYCVLTQLVKTWFVRKYGYN